jgi:3-phenylpropionate/trans-cinnamate dioxygenase ferredoxin reductase subunit
VSDGVVIVGAGQAGFQLAWSLRTEGYGERITLIGDEPHLPYQRPPLSKGFLQGKQQLDSATLRPEKFFADHRIDLILRDRVTSIRERVQLESGTSLDYDYLVLATGAHNRQLPIEAVYLRGIDDALLLKDQLDRASTITIIGGGFIGLEVAAAAAAAGKEVTVLELQPRLMARAVAPIVSDFFRDLHTRNGVKLIFGPAEIPPADLTVVGVGVIPNTELAEDAGLAVSTGIDVDDHLRTANPKIFAIGDCAAHCTLGRIESVQNAVDQAKCVAANIAGKPKPYSAIPWFWTDQYDAKLQMAGISAGFDQVVLRGAAPKFSAFYFRSGKLIAADSINRPADHMLARKLLAAGSSITPEHVADESLSLATLIA